MSGSKENHWNTKVMVKPNVIGSLGTVPPTKDLEKKLRELEIRDRIQITQTTELLKSARIFRRV